MTKWSTSNVMCWFQPIVAGIVFCLYLQWKDQSNQSIFNWSPRKWPKITHKPFDYSDLIIVNKSKILHYSISPIPSESPMLREFPCTSVQCYPLSLRVCTIHTDSILRARIKLVSCWCTEIWCNYCNTNPWNVNRFGHASLQIATAHQSIHKQIHNNLRIKYPECVLASILPVQ